VNANAVPGRPFLAGNSARANGRVIPAASVQR
jgi:hypothetical protein